MAGGFARCQRRHRSAAGLGRYPIRRSASDLWLSFDLTSRDTKDRNPDEQLYRGEAVFKAAANPTLRFTEENRRAPKSH